MSQAHPKDIVPGWYWTIHLQGEHIDRAQHGWETVLQGPDPMFLYSSCTVRTSVKVPLQLDAAEPPQGSQLDCFFIEMWHS